MANNISSRLTPGIAVIAVVGVLLMVVLAAGALFQGER